MKFSLFTTRTRKPSLRLRILARAFQAYSVLNCVGTVGLYFYIEYFLDHSHTPRWAFTPPYAYIAVTSLSLFLVGRALLRRQRWGAFLAGATLGAPIIKQLISPYEVGPGIPGFALSTLALCALITVWDELGGAHDADFDEERATDTGDDEPTTISSSATGTDEIGSVPTRSAYREPRLLTTPAPTINNATARSPLPISTARDS